MLILQIFKMNFFAVACWWFMAIKLATNFYDFLLSYGSRKVLATRREKKKQREVLKGIAKGKVVIKDFFFPPSGSEGVGVTFTSHFLLAYCFYSVMHSAKEKNFHHSL